MLKKQHQTNIKNNKKISVNNTPLSHMHKQKGKLLLLFYQVSKWLKKRKRKTTLQIYQQLGNKCKLLEKVNAKQIHAKYCKNRNCAYI
jgi:hypothetical protein